MTPPLPSPEKSLSTYHVIEVTRISEPGAWIPLNADFPSPFLGCWLRGSTRGAQWRRRNWVDMMKWASIFSPDSSRIRNAAQSWTLAALLTFRRSRDGPTHVSALPKIVYSVSLSGKGKNVFFIVDSFYICPANKPSNLYMFWLIHRY